MPIPAIAFAAASAIPSLFGLFSGQKQKREAQRLAANNRLTQYSTPTEVLQATQLAERNYLQGLPGQDIIQQNIERGGAQAYQRAERAATTSGDILDSVSRINYQQNQAMNDLAVQAAQYQQQALGQYQNQLMNQAGYRDREYQFNEYEPYIRTANQAAAMYGAGQTNIAQGIGGLTNSLIAAGLGYNNLQGQQERISGPQTRGVTSYLPPSVQQTIPNNIQQIQPNLDPITLALMQRRRY